jgi:hypothetical protein
MAAPLTGGCACGAVRYECTAESVMAFNCHCRDCQRATGGAYVPAVVIPRNALKVTGEVRYFGVRGESGQILNRGFCPNCGSRLFGKPDFKPDLMVIVAGSLDDPSRHKPTMDIYAESAQPWDYMNPQLPKVPKAPQLPVGE